MRRDIVPLYPAIPAEPHIPVNQAADFYGDLGTLIADENPYGKKIFALDIATLFDNSEAVRPQKMSALRAAGVRIMGWLRNAWSEKPILSCNDRMTVSEKQQSFHWLTMYPEEATPQFPNDDNAAPAAFDPPKPCNEAQFDINDLNRGVIQNSPDYELNQVCKAIYVPFEYEATDGRRLRAAILVGYVGSGGGQ
jgi:hypothetical protein